MRLKFSAGSFQNLKIHESKFRQKIIQPGRVLLLPKTISLAKKTDRREPFKSRGCHHHRFTRFFIRMNILSIFLVAVVVVVHTLL